MDSFGLFLDFFCLVNNVCKLGYYKNNNYSDSLAESSLPGGIMGVS